jgi:hypothetical protein
MGADITRYEYKITDGHQYYYQVMRKTIVQFLDLFNDIKIGRYDTETGQLLSFIKVPLKFAPKSKNWYWTEKIDSSGNRIRDKVLPVMAANLIDIEIAADRKVNKHYSSRTSSHSTSGNRRLMAERFINPVPYNYTFQLQIISEYMVDITQIMEQLLPYFDPYLFIQISIPELNIDGNMTEILNLKVLYNGSNKDESLTMSPDENRHIQWNIDFTVEGYLFQPKYDFPVIKTIYEEMIIGSQKQPHSICETAPTPSGSQTTLTTDGLSASHFPLDVTSEELSGSIYDDDIKTIYNFEIQETL